MATVNLKISVIALAIGMFALTSCGGNANKKQGKMETYEIGDTKIKATQQRDTWPSNQYTKLLPKPEIAISETYVGKIGDQELFSVHFDKPSLEQVKVYVEQLKKEGWTVTPIAETTKNYSMEIKNATGYEGVVLWQDMYDDPQKVQSSLSIGKTTE
jgi:hypothetical protein